MKNRNVFFHHSMLDEKIRSGRAKFRYIWIYDVVIEGVYELIRVPRSRWHCLDKWPPHKMHLAI